MDRSAIVPLGSRHRMAVSLDRDRRRFPTPTFAIVEVVGRPRIWFMFDRPDKSASCEFPIMGCTEPREFWGVPIKFLDTYEGREDIMPLYPLDFRSNGPCV